MPKNTPGTPADGTTLSCSNPTGLSHQPSALAAAPACSTQIGQPSCETSDAVLILTAMVAGITAYTTSGDALKMAMYTAEDICFRHGLARELTRPLLLQFLEQSRSLRAWNPLAY
jgi:hypothetical protein